MAETQEATYKQVKCPICLETFQSPKVLACLHTFCEKCICKHACSQREANAQSELITCPVCITPTPAPTAGQTPDEWAAKLANNTIVLSLLASTQSGKNESVYCQPCLTLGKQTISLAYCATCSEYLCDICYTCHKSFKMTKDHSITVQSMPADQNWNSAQSDMYRCSLHEEQYKYICTNHNELCCSDCVIKDHRKCDGPLLIKDLSRRSKEVQDKQNISEKLDAAKTMFIALLESRSQNLSLIEQQKIAITKSIVDWSTSIKEFIDGLKMSALDELDQMCKQEIITISDQIVECKSAIAAIETSEEMLMKGRQLEDDTKIFITTTKVSCQALKYLERYKTMENNQERVELEFHFDNTFDELLKTLSSIGKLTRKVAKNPKMLYDSSFATTITPNIQPNSMAIFSARIDNDTNVCNIRSGVFLSDERLVLCDEANTKLKLFDRYFHFVSHLKMDYSPRYMCRVDEDTVAVTVSSDIKLVSVTDKLSLLRSISVGEDCYGIASHQHNIIVDIYEDIRDSLFTYDTSDKLINMIMSYDSLKVHNTHCVSQDGQNIYYTANNAVVTMDMKGNKLNMFTSNDLKGASGIVIDKLGLIYCCGMESKTVIAVTPDGRQLCVLLSGDHKLQNPHGICLNERNDTILLFEVNSNDVKVFKKN
ncbi:hypothetical protein ACJMK2_023967 [Sinanodonta woodiana]|uniref:RING-type domain-containing protein n=1 Tax=Sinanodonta woodiana TaxID=1069815 RepID=A0ABD3T6N6_SINWO